MLGAFALTDSPPNLGNRVYWYLHVLAYALLFWWFAQALPARARWPLAGLLAALGLGLELAQALVPTRQAHWSDVGCNLLGLGSGALLARVAPAQWILALGQLLRRKRGEGGAETGLPPRREDSEPG